MLELVWKFIFCPITWVTFLAIAIFLQINGGKDENGKEDRGNVFNNMLIEEAMYSDSWSVNMIAYYCWMLNQRVISVKFRNSYMILSVGCERIFSNATYIFNRYVINIIYIK